MSVPYKLIGLDGSRHLAVYANGSLHTLAEGSHPLFRPLLEGLENATLTEDEAAAMAGSFGEVVKQATKGLSNRVRYDPDRRALLFDGEVLNTSLSRHIVRILTEEGMDAAEPWVLFMEKLAENPSRRSRMHLYSWLESCGDFTLTRSGDILGYKAVREDRTSITSGDEKVLVNGVEHIGHIPNPNGAVIQMDRSEVDDDRDAACSVGLHIGNYEYAEAFGGNGAILLLVAVNPADVVAVPRDSHSQKMRACRYEVLGEAFRRERVRQAVWDHPDAQYRHLDIDEDGLDEVLSQLHLDMEADLCDDEEEEG